MVKVTHGERVVYPADGWTKADVVEHYGRVDRVVPRRALAPAEHDLGRIVAIEVGDRERAIRLGGQALEPVLRFEVAQGPCVVHEGGDHQHAGGSGALASSRRAHP